LSASFKLEKDSELPDQFGVNTSFYLCRNLQEFLTKFTMVLVKQILSDNGKLRRLGEAPGEPSIYLGIVFNVGELVDPAKINIRAESPVQIPGGAGKDLVRR
jgi:hypothetical protein